MNKRFRKAPAKALFILPASNLPTGHTQIRFAGSAIGILTALLAQTRRCLSRIFIRQTASDRAKYSQNGLLKTTIHVFMD